MDRGIAEEIARAGGTSVSKLGLRFDRVVVRILDDLSRFTERAAPANRCVLVTISAPIRLPARTERVLEQEIDALLAGPWRARTKPRTSTATRYGCDSSTVRRSGRRGSSALSTIPTLTPRGYWISPSSG